MIAKRWIARWQETERVASLARALGTSQVLASLLPERGSDDEQSAHVFLYPSCLQLYDPYLILGLREAVSRLLRAIDQSVSMGITSLASETCRKHPIRGYTHLYRGSRLRRWRRHDSIRQ